MKTSVLNIKGMGCSGCVDSVQNALTGLEGVEEAKVDLNSGKAEVTYSEESLTKEDFEKAVSNAGYAVTGMN